MVKSVSGTDVEARSSAISKVDDSNEVAVMKTLEKAAVSGDTFYFDASMDTDSRSKLTEMASIAGVRVEPTNAAAASVFKSVSNYVGGEKRKTEVADITKAGFADPDSFKKSDSWNTVESTRQKFVEETPSPVSGVRPIRGGDEYGVSPNMNPRTGEASIVSPEVKGASDTSESTRDMIRRLAGERKDSISFDKTAWEVETMSSVDTAQLPRNTLSGYVSETNRNSATPLGQHSMIAAKDSSADTRMDTAEAIRKENSEKKSSIQRKSDTDRSWDSEKSSVQETVSDVFYESLKKALGK